jgi:superfamily II DNA or RNA helicase
LGVPEGEERVILATGRYIGEGFDDARLDTLFLTMPISWKGTLAQYVGRLHRQYSGKADVLVADHVDAGVPVLAGKAASWIPHGLAVRSKSIRLMLIHYLAPNVCASRLQ